MPRKKKSDTEVLEKAVAEGGTAEATFVEPESPPEEEEETPDYVLHNTDIPLEEAVKEEPQEEVAPRPVMPSVGRVKLADISSMPTKNIKKSPIRFEDNDTKVYDWYQAREAGQRYTLEQVALELDLSVEELCNSLDKLRRKLLPSLLHHISDYP